MRRSKLECSITCISEGNCVAFSYNKTSGLCNVCSDYSVKSLVVDTGPSETFYVLRQNIQYVEMSDSSNVDTWLDLPCGLTVGNMIVLRGVYANSSGFIFEVHQDIDIQILHFRPRDYLIAINHFMDGLWGEGVYLKPTPEVFPFKHGEKFVVHILALVDNYAIFVDGNFLHSYQYVIPPTDARLIRVTGSIKLLQIVLRGVYANTSGFVFLLHRNSNDQMLNFRPRENSITINHFINGQWGYEVLNTPQVFPFNVGEKFVVHILAGVNNYVIFVNGNYLNSYQYVLPLSAVRLMKVNGSIKLLQVGV
ncbi:uncharacterized protein LOC131952498 [Physella acuta]|uniref:uncharacterized protein LOC131952498 n=1 Tax=Physella acuta TaxID=109671 RepID=UPI0027DD61E5|nr:uncharacterized protein LOC131952498 [Physella acuta]